MNLYTVILVDDEEEVRQAIIQKLDWESIGFQVIGFADNGEEALEIAERLRPDVVMTDIKMPFMDGLTLCKKLKQMLKDTKLIIFSGFDEFEYAKEAIKLEVEEYILKPINSSELKAVFERIKGQIDRERNEKINIEKLRKYYIDSLPVMQEQFLIGLLEGNVSKNHIDELSKSYEIDLYSPYYMVGIIRADRSSKSNIIDENMINQTEFITLSLKQIVDESLTDCAKFKSCLYLESVVVVALLEDTKQSLNFIYTMDQICKSVNRILGNNTSAGIGFVCEKLVDLSHSYKGAKSAMDYRILFEPNQALYILDIEPQVEDKSIWDGNYTESIIKEIKLGEVDDLEKVINTLILYLKNSKISLQQYQITLMGMITEIFKLGMSYQLDMDIVLGSNYNIYNEIYKFDSLNTLKQWLLDICMKVRGSIRHERTASAQLLTEKATEYIRENYHENDLSVDTLCSYLNVSAAYFSTIFKRETGMSFISYLTKVRMDKALQLLNATDDKTYIISTKVGYIEPNYFSYVFKKQYGISPSKYRTSRQENNDN